MLQGNNLNNLNKYTKFMTEEDRIQASCIKWFQLQYPKLSKLCFSVPNGGARSKATAGILKATGVVAGVADLILLVPSFKYASLCIEMKTPKGTQSESQKEWQKVATDLGNQYVLCRSFDEFKEVIEEYLSPK